ncbi:MAG: flagellar biosynthesis anti-sigma factor FlgM [Oscillospiraceae bacterium]|nr:flagellar biosynthesis anti-sigma factor FlgM [Oscillospiraceae bacterium]
MKIYDVTKVYGVYDAQPVAGRSVKKPGGSVGADKLVLSKDAIDFQAVMKGLKEAPDIRAEKVREFAAKYEAGDHLADTRDIAEALFKSGAMKKTQSP